MGAACLTGAFQVASPLCAPTWRTSQRGWAGFLGCATCASRQTGWSWRKSCQARASGALRRRASLTCAPALRAAGLTAVNISLDSLVPAKFELLTRRSGHERVLGAIQSALDAGYAPVKLNCVVMRGVNDDELLDFVALTRERDINVRFIEYMPFDGNAWAAKKMVSFAEMRAAVLADHPGMLRADDGPTEVAKNYRLPGHVGSVSFVTSMSSHFCAGCNRLRLMADGALKVCLFGSNEISLRDPMRAGASDTELAQLIGAAVRRKKAVHAGIAVDSLVSQPNRAMVRIGG